MTNTEVTYPNSTAH